MDKHWKELQVGDVIEITTPEGESTEKIYFKLCEGEFTVPARIQQKADYKFYGKHLKFVGATFKDDFSIIAIQGYEVLENLSHKVVDESPKYLYRLRKKKTE